MSLTVEEVCAELEGQHMQYQAQQKTAEQVFHQCAGAMNFIRAKIDEVRKKDEEAKAKALAETPAPESTAEAVMD